MKWITRRACVLLLAGLGVVPSQAIDLKRLDLSKLVVVGDSLSAGVQNISLVDFQQPNSYAALIAKQAGVPMTLPLIEFPGDPSHLTVSGGRVVPVTANPLPPVGRLNPGQQPTNLSVPGFALRDAMTMRPTAGIGNTPAENVPRWANLVLGYPIPFNQAGTARTQVEQALELKPTTLIVWIGNNDALVPALIGALPPAPQSLLTPPAVFETQFRQLLETLATAKAPMIVANIPDITKIPYFTSIEDLASKYARPVDTVERLLGVKRGDFLRSSALHIADNILRGSAPGPLPALCASVIAALPVPAMPCVMTAAQAKLVQDHVDAYNTIIKAETQRQKAVLVDIHQLVDNIAKWGYYVNGRRLTTKFLGGLFSLDGMHPNNTGYAIIANEFIKEMNLRLWAFVLPVSVSKVFREDPLAQYIGDPILP